MPAFDVHHARAAFPALEEPSATSWIHAENAGGSPICQQSLDRLVTYLRTSKVQGGYPNEVSARSAAAQAEGAAALAPWLGVPADHLHIGPSTTQNSYVLAQALGEVLGPDDAVVVTEQDHEANAGSLCRLAARGVEVRTWPVDPTTGSLDGAGLARLLDQRVRVVAFPHASNVVGAVNPVAEWAATVREAGAVSIVDGVAFAPHGLPDVAALGADVYLFSAYKTYGPHQGVLVARPELVERLPNQGHAFNAGLLAKRLVPAGPDHAQVAALAGIADYLRSTADHHADPGATDGAQLVRSLWRAHEVAVTAPLLAWLDEQPRVRVIGPTDADRRVPTIAFVVDGVPSREVARRLGEARILAGAGHFYARRLVEAVGIDPDDGVVRLSFVHTTTDTEIVRVTEALDATLG